MQIIKPIKPVDELTVKIVREVQKKANELGLELLLVGAQAKVILLENIHGLNPGRATADIDFAFSVESWDQFDQIKQSLVSTGKFRELSKEKQRLRYKSRLVEHEFIVDIIPFGAIQSINKTIAWPTEMDIVMSVSGYQEALATALIIEIEPDLAIKVVSLAGLAILKIFAWSDRATITENKDAVDLLTLSLNYHQAGNMETIYEVLPQDVMESVEYNPEQMGAWLLGYDVAATSGAGTVDEIKSLIESKKDNLILQMAKPIQGNENALDVVERLLSSFMQGMQRYKK